MKKHAMKAAAQMAAQTVPKWISTQSHAVKQKRKHQKHLWTGSNFLVSIQKHPMQFMDYLLQLYTRLVGGSESAGCCSNSARKIICFGNVLLDHTAQVSDTELFKRFELKPDTRGELDVEKLHELRAQICESIDCKASIGGSALNTVRILRHLGTDALFFGAVGDDEHAEELRKILEDRGVEARLQSVAETPTGQCICLIHNQTSTLLANIGASSKFSLDFLKHAERNAEQPPFLRPIERKQILYMEGFFLPQREEVTQYIVKTYIHQRRRLALNLSAEYIVKQNYDVLIHLVRNAFFLFGNLKEFETLRDHMNCKSFEDMAQELVAGGAIKIIVITKGADGFELISNYVDEYSEAGDLKFQCFNAPRVERVVDTTGAGDAFVAGFLHAFLEKRSLSECMRVAGDVSAHVVQQIGCNLPEDAKLP